MPNLSEFDLIDRLLKPLASRAPGAFSLTDDAAILPPLPKGHVHVVTKDAVSVGVHMRAADPPSDMARKALRVNLSDLAAMGAEPVGLFMALCLGADTTTEFIEAFVGGLATDLEHYELPLMGGDIIRHDGPFLVSVTAIGSAAQDQVLRRAGARPGDSLWVSGTIGDGALGLQVLEGGLPGLSEDDSSHLIDRYRRPQPRLALGRALHGLASACIDISDGLVADVGHLCHESGVGCAINSARIPLSPAAKSAVERDPKRLETVLTGGDDYELAFAVPPEKEEAVIAASQSVGVAVRQIGRFTNGQGVTVHDESGGTITVAQSGFRHV